MDSKIKKACPNCSQLFQLLSCQTSQIKGNLPLLLTCGHTMCESCVRNIVKFGEPVECKVCKHCTEFKSSDVVKIVDNKKEFYKAFPVNMFMLGELTMELMDARCTQKDDNENYFVDLQSIIKSSDNTIGECIECHQTTMKMCQQCETILCDHCFNRSHKNFIVFKNHVLKNIEPLTKCNKCELHNDKILEYYCKDCTKSICMDCLMVGGEKSCKNHNIASMQEVNESFLENLNEIYPKVDETFRRLTKTAVDIGHLLYNLENETGSVSELTQLIASVEQHFSKLTSIVQKHKTEVVNIITKLKCSEKESLYKAKQNITESIKKAKEILNTMQLYLDPKKIKQMNLSVLFDEATQVVESKWYLNRDTTDKKEPLKVAVNEDLCTLISDYIHLEGNADPAYVLKSTKELDAGLELPPAPPVAVFPPELPKDVRQIKTKAEKVITAKPNSYHQQVPKFRSKHGSTTSLNSIGSDTSYASGATRFSESIQRPMIQQVMPFSESRQPRQLHEGNQELIYISHIVDPHNFYVQRADHQELVKEMFREFRNAVSSPRPTISNLIEGRLYVVYNKKDSMWQRCRLVSIDRRNPNNPWCQVFCIDFGSTCMVSAERLRLLQPGRVQFPPPLAIKCCLANCVPKTGEWTQEDSLLIRNIINNKQAVIFVRYIRSTSNFDMTVECDVTTIEEGVSLAHALVFHERARLPNPKLVYPKICGLSERPKMFLYNNTLKPKTVEEVSITNILSPDKFYVRECHLQTVYEKLTEDMEAEYSLDTNNDYIYLPEVEMICVVNLEKYRSQAEMSVEGGWMRAVVKELPGRTRVRVVLPDTGTSILVHWSALRTIRPKFTTMRALATECHLAGVTPLNKKWSAGSVALLQRFEDRLLELHVEDSRNRSSIGVILYDKSDEENVVCVNNEMLKYKFAISFGLFRFNKNNAVEDQVITNKSPLQEDKKATIQGQHKLKILKRSEDLDEINEDNLEAKDKGPLRLEATVLQYQSPSLMYISLVHQQKAFNSLFENMQKFYSKQKKDESKNDWKESDRCSALCEESKTWRRGVIVELNEEKAKVFYTDFASIETVPLTSLRELTPDFASIGDAAIKCHLCGIMPAVGEEWPSLAKEYLKELLEVYQRVFVTKLGNFKAKSMPIELWVYHTVQGGALEPNTSEWRCLNKKIIEQGLGIPDKSQEVAPEANKDEDDEMLSFLNVTGSVREWLQLEPLSTKPSLAKCDSDCATSPSTPDVCEDVLKTPSSVPNSSNTVFISDWLPPEPLPTKEFTAVPTYIDNDGVIYLHDISQQATLELIRKALDVRFVKPDPKAKFAKWTVGEPCVAQFFLDSHFYRGRVTEVNTEAASCMVHYVDYGNEEVCSFENMRKSIALHQIAIQAHKCILNRIRPIGNRWDRTTLDYIHKSIVEKQCLAKIAGEPVGDLIPIDLKYDKLWINEHLVDFEMAEFTDGTKTVVRKYAPKLNYKQVEDNVDIKSDSGPEYIEEDDSTSVDALSSAHDCSFDMKSMENKDWNIVMAEDHNPQTGIFTTFPKNDDEEFLCNITIIEDPNILELAIIHNDETNLIYEELFADLQKEGSERPKIEGIYENKACIALFHEDGQWYRASILQYSKSKNLVKVRYVDYGNTSIVSLTDIREIDVEWAKLPPAVIQARLNDLTINSELDITDVINKFIDTFLDKGPFQAKIVKYTNMLPAVELRNEDGESAYSKLIGIEVLVPLSTNPID